MTRTIKTAIIGAGPYGLSVAAHMRGAGVSHEIFGSPVESWRQHMPEGMVLRSEVFAASMSDPDRALTLKAFCKDANLAYNHSGPPISLKTWLDYADWFQRRAAPQVQDVKVNRLSRRDGKFHLAFENGDEAYAESVVLAAGHRYFRNTPPILAELNSPLVTHSDDHRDLSPFIGKDVVMVGGGQSSLETAALLNEQGTRVRVLVREDHVVWHEAHPGTQTFMQELVRPELGLGFGWKNQLIAELPNSTGRSCRCRGNTRPASASLGRPAAGG